MSIHPPHQYLRADEYFYNAIHAFYRARVEHINAVFDKHIINIIYFIYSTNIVWLLLDGMFQTVFRGGYDLLEDCCDVTVHTTNVDLHQRIRYEPYGPWSHFWYLVFNLIFHTLSWLQQTIDHVLHHPLLW